ncbi:hypothetical protein GW915_03965 [bacterium]|nr:hypothetical protein [bacterium]
MRSSLRPLCICLGLCGSLLFASEEPTLAEIKAAQQERFEKDYFEGFPPDADPFMPLFPRDSGYNFRNIGGFDVMIERFTAVETQENGEHRFGYYNIIYIGIPEGAKVASCGADSRLLEMSFKTGVPFHAIFPSFAPNILCNLEKFYKDQLALRPSRRKGLAVLEEERPFVESGPALVVAITKENDLSNIYAMARVVHRGNQAEDNRLDVERRLNMKLPEIPLKQRISQYGPYLEGAWAELKSLVRAKESPEKFIPMLFASIFNIRAHKAVGTLRERFSRPLADHYITEADPAMKNIHRRWGFQALHGYGDEENKLTWTNRWNLEGLMSGMLFMNDPQPFSIVNSQDESPWMPSLVLQPSQLEELKSKSSQPGPKNLKFAGEVISCEGLLEAYTKDQAIKYFWK